MKVVAKPIDMVVWFSHDGAPNPLKFRVENDDNSFSVIKVDKVLQKDMERLAGNNMLVFRCQSIINGQERVYEIKYELRTCKWILFKI
jgi:hypothetical protein